jgi:mono/diheme cytochrome c family protein
VKARAALAAFVFAAAAAAAEGEAGRRIYTEALTPSGAPLRALVGIGRTPIAGAAVACRNCHGADGRGRPEAGVTPPQITWDELTKPYGRVRGSRKRGAFDERSFHRAVTEGLDPAGNVLDWAMPRYSLSAGEAAALVAYLKRVALERDPGIKDDALRIGVAPGLRPVLESYVERLEIHQRRIELVAGDDVFARLGPTGLDVGGQRFQVIAGYAELAAVLVEFAARRAEGAGIKAAVLASSGEPHPQAAQAARQRCGKLACALVDGLDERVFFFGSAPEFAGFLDRAARQTRPPSVYASGALIRTALAARPAFGGEIFLVFPTAPPEHPVQAVANVLVEGLRRAGRELSRERFLRSLGNPRALGGYVVALDREGGIAPASGWISLD